MCFLECFFWHIKRKVTINYYCLAQFEYSCYFTHKSDSLAPILLKRVVLEQMAFIPNWKMMKEVIFTLLQRDRGFKVGQFCCVGVGVVVDIGVAVGVAICDGVGIGDSVEVGVGGYSTLVVFQQQTILNFSLCSKIFLKIVMLSIARYSLFTYLILVEVLMLCFCIPRFNHLLHPNFICLKNPEISVHLFRRKSTI